jgi:hypothetical protein
MWKAKSADELLAESRNRRRCNILVAMVAWLVFLYSAALCPVWHGRSLAGVILPAFKFAPGTAANLAILVLALCAGYWSRRLRSDSRRVMICQKCNRVKTSDGQTQCNCGGTFSPLHQMKWVPGMSDARNQPENNLDTHRQLAVTPPITAQ